MSAKIRACCCGNKEVYLDNEIEEQPAVVCDICRREVTAGSKTAVIELWNNLIASRKRWRAEENKYKRDPFPRPLPTGVKTIRDKVLQLTNLTRVIEDKKLRDDMQDRLRIMRRILMRSQENKD